MTGDQKILKWSLLAGALYFFMVSVAHLIGWKVPVLFVYFNVPSQAYQDGIISFLAFGWAVFLFTAQTNLTGQDALVRAVLVSGGGALVGLGRINLFTDFNALGAQINPAVFWLETAGLFAYWLCLLVFYLRTKRG